MLNGKWMWAIGALFLVGCAAHLQQAPDSKNFQGKTYWLKKSLYGGIFYDDDRYRFMSDTPFEKLTHLKMPSGDFIVPPPSDEVVVFGTRVQVQKIEWPDEKNLIKRPILTPRVLPWVYLTVALDRGSVTLNHEKTYIMLVPEQVHNETDLKLWLETYFSEHDNNLLFLNLGPAERAAILKPSK